MKNLDTARATIVLIGTFSPDLLGLSQLHKAKVIGQDDFAAATYTALAPGQLVQLTLPWGKFHVEKGRIVVEAAQAPYVRAADLTLRSLRELDPTCKVSMMGINLHATFLFQKMADRDALGVRLVPPTGWGSWGRKIAESIPKADQSGFHGGMSLAVMRSMRDDGTGGWVDVRVEPAFTDKRGYGTSIMVNDHYPTPAPQLALAPAIRAAELMTTETLLTTLEETFDASIQRSLEIVESIASGD